MRVDDGRRVCGRSLDGIEAFRLRHAGARSLADDQRQQGAFGGEGALGPAVSVAEFIGVEVALAQGAEPPADDDQRLFCPRERGGVAAGERRDRNTPRA